MSAFLRFGYCWKVVTSDGLVKQPESRWGGPHPDLCDVFPTREDAIETYSKVLTKYQEDKRLSECPPASLILVEEHYIDWNWD